MPARIQLALSASATAGAAALALVGVGGAAPAPSLVLRPSTIHAGGVVRMRGAAGGCRVGDTVFVISRGFPHVHDFAGVPAVLGKVRPNGHFRAGTRIPSRRLPGRYSVSVRCGGGNLGITRTLTVVR